MIKVNYDPTTGEIKGFYPDFISYETIPEPYIEIDKTAHQDCINNQGLRRVDVTTKKIITYTPPEPTAAEVKQSKINALNTNYNAQFEELSKSLGLASLANDADLIAELRIEYDDLKTAYTAELEVINNG